MAFEEEYFVLRYDRPLDKVGNPTSVASVVKDAGCPSYDEEYKFVKNPDMMFYRFGKNSKPSKTNMFDWLYPDLVSEKLYSALSTMDIKGLQLLPAIIKFKDKEYKYWCLNIYNVYSVLDMEKSKYRWMETIKVANLIEKLVFNETELAKIPLEERLVFRLAENTGKYFFHKQIIDELLKIEPKSFKFIAVSEYGGEN